MTNIAVIIKTAISMNNDEKQDESQEGEEKRVSGATMQKYEK